jgi:hypothetical protein
MSRKRKDANNNGIPDELELFDFMDDAMEPDAPDVSPEDDEPKAHFQTWENKPRDGSKMDNLKRVWTEDWDFGEYDSWQEILNVASAPKSAAMEFMYRQTAGRQFETIDIITGAPEFEVFGRKFTPGSYAEETVKTNMSLDLAHKGATWITGDDDYSDPTKDEYWDVVDYAEDIAGLLTIQQGAKGAAAATDDVIPSNADDTIDPSVDYVKAMDDAPGDFW